MPTIILLRDMAMCDIGREGTAVQKSEFYTLKGYESQHKQELSFAMEDYLEMISRLSQEIGFVRVNRLAQELNVTPPSASKMAAKLRLAGYVDYEHYGLIRLTDKGREVGNYLLHRHAVLQRFFSALNRCGDELEVAEKIEHFIDARTIANMERLLPLIESREQDT